ncbi:hypothetical protein Tco_0437650, partial [Tanacetum coccineum]
WILEAIVDEFIVRFGVNVSLDSRFPLNVITSSSSILADNVPAGSSSNVPADYVSAGHVLVPRSC